MMYHINITLLSQTYKTLDCFIELTNIIADGHMGVEMAVATQNRISELESSV